VTIPKPVRFLLRPFARFVRAAAATGRKLLWDARSGFGIPVRVSLGDGGTLKLYPAGQIPELLVTADFEDRELNLVTSYLRPGMNVIDIGANVGLYSIAAALTVGRTGKVFAFEPSSETVARLRRNLELNGITTVQLATVALSDKSQSVAVLKRDAHHRDGDRYLQTQTDAADVTAQAGDPGDAERVGVTALDEWMQTNGIGDLKIDFLKMDIEGGELAVFKGARETLRRNPDIVLMFECTKARCARYGHTQQDVFNFLQGLGFHIFAWDEKHSAWSGDEALLLAVGNVWAIRDASRLPQPKASQAR
jgi:FkbM family methyltransferase